MPLPSQLDAKASMVDSDILVVETSGGNVKKITGTEVRTYTVNNLTADDIAQFSDDVIRKSQARRFFFGMM